MEVRLFTLFSRLAQEENWTITKDFHLSCNLRFLMPGMMPGMFPGMMPPMPKLSPQCIACFNQYDKDKYDKWAILLDFNNIAHFQSRDKALSIAEFTQICKHMFRKPSGMPYV